MSRPATVADLRRIAAGMPHVTEFRGATTRSDTTGRPDTSERPVYQVGGRSFVFFRSPRPDAVDSATGRLADVIVIWVTSEAEKAALVQDPASPFFTTAHFDGHLSVLVQARLLPEIGLDEPTEIVQDTWLSRASRRRAAAWLTARRQDQTE